MKARDALRGLSLDLDGAWNHAAGLLLPAVLLGLAFVGERGLLRLSPDARGVVGVLPLLVALTGLALAWRFDRGRLLLGLMLVLTVFVAERAAWPSLA